MAWSTKKLLLVGLGVVILVLVGPAWGQDADGDGVPDAQDACPDSDPNFPVDINGCPDTDDDGVADVNDLCPGTPPLTQVNADGCIDTDGDGITDGDDVCPGISDPCQLDGDGDGVGDECDACPATDPNHGVDTNGCSIADQYDYSTHFVAGRVVSVAVDGDDNILLARRGRWHYSQLQIQVVKHDPDFGTPLATFWTPAPPDDPSTFCYPHGLDVDPAGNVVIAMQGGLDNLGNRVSEGKFTLSTITATGAPVSQYDVTDVVTPPASDSRKLRGGACDNDGNFWWLDVYRDDDPEPDVILRRSTLLNNDSDPCTGGSLIMRIENDDHPPIGYTGTDGALHSVDVDADGLVYVGDLGRIWRFDPCDIAGTAVALFDEGVGGAPGQFGGFTGAVGGLTVKNGKIYAADNATVGGPPRIQIFEQSTGKFIQQRFLPLGTGITDMDVDSQGNIYLHSVGPENNPGTIHKFTFFVDTDGDGVGDHEDLCPGTPGATQVAADGCPDADGDGVADADDLCPGTPGGTEVAPDGCVDIDADGVGDDFDACITDPCDPNFAGAPVGPDGCPMQLAYNYDWKGTRLTTGDSIAVDSSGDVLLACAPYGGHPALPVDRYKAVTLKFLDTLWIDVPGGPPEGPSGPAGLDVDDEGNIVIYTAGADRQWALTTFDNAGTVISQHVLPNEPNDVSMANIGVDGDGNVWTVGLHLSKPLDPGTLTSANVFRIELLSNDDGSVIQTVDADDLAPAGIIGGWKPGGIAVDDNGLVYVDFSKRIIRFDPCDVGSTAVVLVPGNAGATDPNELDDPGKFGGQDGGVDGVAVLGDRLYVGDGENERVQVFKASTGQFIQELLQPGPFVGLDDIDVDWEGKVYGHLPGSEHAVSLHLWAPPFCGDPLHQPPAGDVDKNCLVDRQDLIDMAELWLLCTHPDGTGCQDLIQAELMYMPHCWDGTRSVDGLLSDWTDPCWVDLDLIYTGEPCDMTSARYTACWDPCEDLIYAAVEVVDTDHVFESAPLDWHTSDRVEIYVQADPNGGGSWGSADSGQYDKAQQYIVGYQNIIPGWTWAVFGHGTYIPDDIEPGDADFTDAGRVSGDTITYEISAKAWQWYGGRTAPVGSVPSIKRELEPGLHVGFDVVADSRRGTPPHDDGEFGMLSANPDTDKYQRAELFQRWALLDYDGSIVPPGCGDWGYYPADVSGDCYVNLSDVLLMYSTWMDCTDPSCAFAQ